MLHIEQEDRRDLNLDMDHVTRMEKLITHIGTSLKPRIKRRRVNTKTK